MPSGEKEVPLGKHLFGVEGLTTRGAQATLYKT